MLIISDGVNPKNDTKWCCFSSMAAFKSGVVIPIKSTKHEWCLRKTR